MEHKPLTKQRSPYVEMKSITLDETTARTFDRRVGDGRLFVLIACEPEIGWHMSISFRNHKQQYSRYPTWDEIMHARLELLPDNIDFVMFLPKDGEYIAVHDTTFHLHQFPPPGDNS